MSAVKFDEWDPFVPEAIRSRCDTNEKHRSVRFRGIFACEVRVLFTRQQIDEDAIADMDACFCQSEDIAAEVIGDEFLVV